LPKCFDAVDYNGKAALLHKSSEGFIS
jgi:hypothetical protein